MSFQEHCAADTPETSEPIDEPLRFGGVYTLAARAMISAQRVELPDTTTKDVDVLQQRAGRLLRLLKHRYEHHMMTPVDAASDEPPRSPLPLARAVESGDLQAQAELGIDLRQLHLDILAETIILGRPVEFQVASHAFNLQLPADAAENQPSESDRSELVTARAHRLLRSAIHNANGHLRTNTLTLHDPTSPLPASRSGAETAEETASAHVIETVMRLRRRGVIEDTDIPGRDNYIKMLMQDNVRQLAPLIAVLERSPYGALAGPAHPHPDHTQPHLTTFMPHPGYIAYAARLTGQTPATIQKIGLPLYSGGEQAETGQGYAFDSALLALDSLTKTQQALRITAETDIHRQLHRQAAALGRFAGDAGMELSQAIYHNGSDAASLLIEAALARALLPHVYRFQQNLGRFANPRHYDARQYNNHNYGAGVTEEQQLLKEKPIIPGMLNEDYRCRKLIVDELYRRFNPRQFTTMYDVYCGPGTSLARILAPYIRDKRDGGSIVMSDLSPSSISFQEDWIHGRLDPTDAQIAERDHTLFDKTDARSIYSEDSNGTTISANDRARGLASARLIDFNDLEPNSCDVLTDGYGTCSSGRPLIHGKLDPIPPNYGTFCEKQKTKFNILRSGGLSVGLHMVNRKSWSAVDAQTKQPFELSSVNLTSKQKIIDAYKDAGFINVFCELVEVEQPHHANTDTDELIPSAQAKRATVAMAVVIAEKP